MLMVSPTGARLTRADHPALPLSIPEIVTATEACVAAGAEALHLHVRDKDGRHSLDPGIYAEALAELDKALPGLPVQVTTEGAGIYGPADQLATLEALRPAWVSLMLREMAMDEAPARRIYALCRDAGTRMQHIVFDAADAARLRRWQEAGVLDRDASVILVLGSYADARGGDPADLAPLRAALPPIGDWMVCAFGPSEHDCLAEAARQGGDLRVGFENAITRADGTPWPDVAASVAALRKRIG